MKQQKNYLIIILIPIIIVIIILILLLTNSSNASNANPKTDTDNICPVPTDFRDLFSKPHYPLGDGETCSQKYPTCQTECCLEAISGCNSLNDFELKNKCILSKGCKNDFCPDPFGNYPVSAGTETCLSKYGLKCYKPCCEEQKRYCEGSCFGSVSCYTQCLKDRGINDTQSCIIY